MRFSKQGLKAVKIKDRDQSVNRVNTKMAKFSLPDSALEEKMVGDEEYEDAKGTWDDDEVKDPRDFEQGEHHPPLEIVEPYEERNVGEHRTVSFKNN